MEATYEPYQSMLDIFPSDMLCEITRFLPLRDQLSLAVSSKKNFTLLSKSILANSDSDNRNYYLSTLRLHSIQGDLLEYLSLTGLTPKYQINSTSSQTTLITICKFLANHQFDQELFNTLLLLAHNGDELPEILSCMTPYFLRIRDRLDLERSLRTEISDFSLSNGNGWLSSFSDKSKVQYVALTQWLRVKDQDHRYISDAATGLLHHYSLAFKGQSLILPSFLMTAKETSFNTIYSLLDSFSKKQQSMSTHVFIKDYVKVLKPLIPYLEPNQATDLKKCILRIAEKICLEIKLEQEENRRNQAQSYLALINIFSQVTNRIDTYLRYRFSHLIEDDSDLIFKQIIDCAEDKSPILYIEHATSIKKYYKLMLALHNDKKDFDYISTCLALPRIPDLPTKLFYAATNSKEIFGDKYNQAPAFLNKSTTIDSLFEDFERLFRNKLLNFSGTQDVKKTTVAFACLIDFNLVKPHENILELLKIDDTMAAKIIFEFKRKIILRFDTYSHILLLCLIKICQQTKNLDIKQDIIMILRNSQSNIYKGIRNELTHVLCNSDPRIIENLLSCLTEDNVIVKKMQSNLQPIGLMCNQFNMPFNKTLAFLAKLRDHDRAHSPDSLVSDFIQILKPSLDQEPLNPNRIFDIIDNLLALIEEEIESDKSFYRYVNRTTNISSNEFRYTLRLAVLNLTDDITVKISNTKDKVNFLEKLRKLPILSEHISTQFFHKIGRSGGEIAIDNKILSTKISSLFSPPNGI